MKTKRLTSTLPNDPILRILLGTIFILSIPFVAMQFTSEVDWGLFDFIIIGTLLVGTGLTYELIARKLGNNAHRVILGIVLVVALLLIWAELAVGVFGTPFAGS